jgi:hypothetical protein
MARGGNNAPKNITWVICLVLYLIAVLSAFNVIHLGGQIGLWSWVIGYALLLVAVKVRGL